MFLGKVAAFGLLFLAHAAPGRAQDPASLAPVPSGARRATVTFGVGNAMGWLGAQGEKYLANERWSVFAGLGHQHVSRGGFTAMVSAGLGFKV